MPYNTSTHIPGDSAPVANLKCGNLRNGFLAFSLLCWLFTLVFLCQVAAYSANPHFAAFGQATNAFFSTPGRMMIGPCIVLLALMYFAYSRKTITWFNGVLIDEQPVAITRYQFKRFNANITFIYLQSPTGKLWILYPVTSQDNVKFKNREIAQKEMAFNETQVIILQGKLPASGATEKRFPFFTRNLIFSLLVFVLVVVLAFAFN